MDRTPAVVTFLGGDDALAQRARHAGTPLGVRIHHQPAQPGWLSALGAVPSLVVVDADDGGGQLTALLAELRATHPHVPVLAHLKDVRTELLQDLKAARIHRTFVRDELEADLPTILRAVA